jgi:hypothetical protein
MRLHSIDIMTYLSPNAHTHVTKLTRVHASARQGALVELQLAKGGRSWVTVVAQRFSSANGSMIAGKGGNSRELHLIAALRARSWLHAAKLSSSPG